MHWSRKGSQGVGFGVALVLLALLLSGCGTARVQESANLRLPSPDFHGLKFALSRKPKVKHRVLVGFERWAGEDLYRYKGEVFTFDIQDYGQRGKSIRDISATSRLECEMMQPIAALEYKGNRYLLIKGCFEWNDDEFQWLRDNGKGVFQTIRLRDLDPLFREIQFWNEAERSVYWTWCLQVLMESAGPDVALQTLKQYISRAPRFPFVRGAIRGDFEGFMDQVVAKDLTSFFDPLQTIAASSMPDDWDQLLSCLFGTLMRLDLGQARPFFAQMYDNLAKEGREAGKDARLNQFERDGGCLLWITGRKDIATLSEPVKDFFFRSCKHALCLHRPEDDPENVYATCLQMYTCRPEEGKRILKEFYQKLLDEKRSREQDARLRAFELHSGHLLGIIGEKK